MRTLSSPPEIGTESLSVFLDFDGTLVDFAARPDLIRVAPSLPPLLTAVRDHLSGRLAVISGRDIGQLDHYLLGSVSAVSGLHGLERRTSDGTLFAAEPPPAIEAARRALLSFEASYNGIFLEDKRLSLAVHFREAPEMETDCIMFIERLAARFDGALSVQHGNMVAEIKPAGANKGMALKAFMNEPPFIGSFPVFIGDDLTDEDGFEAATQAGGYGILVGPERETKARARLDSVGAVHAWLSGLMERPAAYGS